MYVWTAKLPTGELLDVHVQYEDLVEVGSLLCCLILSERPVLMIAGSLFGCR